MICPSMIDVHELGMQCGLPKMSVQGLSVVAKGWAGGDVVRTLLALGLSSYLSTVHRFSALSWWYGAWGSVGQMMGPPDLQLWLTKSCIFCCIILLSIQLFLHISYHHWVMLALYKTGSLSFNAVHIYIGLLRLRDLELTKDHHRWLLLSGRKQRGGGDSLWLWEGFSCDTLRWDWLVDIL